MRHRKTMTTAAVLAAFLAAGPLAAGATGTMAQVKDGARTASQTITTAVSDTWITAKTKIALFADERVKGTQISVETMKGGIVHLRGKVDSADARAAAAEIAGRIDGVTSVKNDLQVVAPALRDQVEARDEDIRKAVEARLARDAQLARVDVRSDAGVVLLTGEVPSLPAAARASEIAFAVPGVKSVKNDLAIRQAGR